MSNLAFALAMAAALRPDLSVPVNVSCTVYPRRLNPLYVVIRYIKWVKTSWTYSILNSMTTETAFVQCT